MRSATLVYCIRDNEVLLGMKKRGFGVGKLNGYGGKVHSSETIINAAARELFEEAKISCNVSDLEKFAEIDFYFPDVPIEKDWNQTVHVFILKKWKGHPQETDEMKPEWYNIVNVPVKKMWIDDEYWLPEVFSGKKIKASFSFSKEGDKILNYKINYVNSF
jgi:8-oxo-dGTP pyrophosphatase MutT (NUDIX family)